MKRLFLLVTTVPLFAGCAAQRAFAPANASTQTSQGYAAAHYEVKTGPDDWGAVQVTVWAEGAEDRRPDKSTASTEGVFVRLAADVVNDWDQPVRLALESARLTALDENGRERDPVSPAEFSAAESVGKGDDRTFRLAFFVPDVRSADLRSFELKWTLRSGEKTYTRKTRFAREAEGDGYYYWPYDPFWYGSFSGTTRARSRGGWGSGVSIGVGVGYSN